jgi:hypothetical protein
VSDAPHHVEVRRFSRALFGNRHKLEILAAIARSDRLFYVQAIADETGIPGPTVRPVVKDIVDVLVRELPAVGSATAPRYHEKLEHPIWQMAVDLLDVVKMQSAAPNSSSA